MTIKKCKTLLLQLYLSMVCVFILHGCAPMQQGMIKDLEVLPQYAEHYIQDPQELLFSLTTQQDLYEVFVSRHFMPWNRSEPRHSAQEVFWGLERYASREIYGENNLPLPKDWLQEMKYRSNIQEYPSLNIPAITVSHASMRVLPTHRPVFYSPSRPGEGFPFDYMQNSLVPAGTPLLITHLSSDHEWVLTETEFAAGWMRWNEVAIAGAEFRNIFERSELAGFTADDVPLLDDNGLHLASGRVGMVLPRAGLSSGQGGCELLVPARDYSGQAKAAVVRVAGDWCQSMPFTPSAQNMAILMDAMMGQRYGWGGLYENRDCSALIRDLFAGFGIFLPRNSRQQAQAGQFISVQGLSAAEKKSFIAENAIPFMTILYMPGHVMLYIGQDDQGRPLVYHSIWGLRTRVPFESHHGRWIIGRTVITTLEPGKEMRNLVKPDGLLIERITGMTFPANTDHAH